MIFEDKRKLLELYNAISGKHYEDPELLEINTLENAIYMSMKNDLSFLIDARLSLYEHQSTYSPNLPVRFLFYLSDMFSGMTADANLYGTKKVELPAPRFVVFYNGEADQPDRQILKLSDLYTVKEEDPMLDLKVLMLNVNQGHNPELMEVCHTLWEYAEYTGRVRKYAKEQPIAEAVERAITECIREGILKELPGRLERRLAGRLERRLEEKLARWINCRSRSRRSWPRGRLSRRSRRPWKRKKILSGGWWKRWDKYHLESEARKILGVVKSV